MQTRYEEAYGVKGIPKESSTVTDRHDTTVTVSFIGIPTDNVLKKFDRYGYKACFFITQQQAEDNTDLLRQLICKGHSIGVYCDKSPEQAVEPAQTAIFAAAQYQPSILFSTAQLKSLCASYAKSNAMALYTADFTIKTDASGTGGAIAMLSSSQSDINICIESVSKSEAYLDSLLKYLKDNDYSVKALRETSF